MNASKAAYKITVDNFRIGTTFLRRPVNGHRIDLARRELALAHAVPEHYLRLTLIKNNPGAA